MCIAICIIYICPVLSPSSKFARPSSKFARPFPSLRVYSQASTGPPQGFLCFKLAALGRQRQQIPRSRLHTPLGAAKQTPHELAYLLYIRIDSIRIDSNSNWFILLVRIDSVCVLILFRMDSNSHTHLYGPLWAPRRSPVELWRITISAPSRHRGRRGPPGGGRVCRTEPPGRRAG